MKQASDKFLKARRPINRRGTTLIEVLAGLLVLGTLLASVTIARGRFIQQWSDADRKIAATHSADALIAQWIAGQPSAIPIGTTGSVDSPAGCAWQTTLIPNPADNALSTAVLRLEVFDPSHESHVLVSIDILISIQSQARAPEAR